MPECARANYQSYSLTLLWQQEQLARQSAVSPTFEATTYTGNEVTVGTDVAQKFELGHELDVDGIAALARATNTNNILEALNGFLDRANSGIDLTIGA